MNKNTGIVVVSATILFLIAGFIICVNAMNNDPEREHYVIWILSVLSSVMTVVVLVYLCMTAEKPSEIYRELYMETRDDSGDGDEKE